MGTERLYDQDPYLREFDARLIEWSDDQGKQRVILDRTLFYPTSGGQPCDEGELGGIPVVDVFEEGKTIVHMLDGKLGAGDRVAGKIDWDRRFDFMQQHTGQHILSQAFLMKVGAETVGFHLGKESSTIDLNVADISTDTIHGTELLANKIVFENRNVIVKVVPFDKLNGIPLRKRPKEEKEIRVVEIEGFDFSGCCGTHVRRTGEVGVIKVIRCERYKGGTRVTFLGGWRALKDYQKKVDTLKTVCQAMTVGEEDVSSMVFRWKEERKISAKRIRSLLDEKLGLEANSLCEKAVNVGPFQMVTVVFENRDPDEIQYLVNKLTRLEGIVTLIGLKGERAHLYFGRSESVDLDVRPLMMEACQVIDGKGGGSSSMARGSGGMTSRIDEALERAKKLVLEKAS